MARSGRPAEGTGEAGGCGGRAPFPFPTVRRATLAMLVACGLTLTTACGVFGGDDDGAGPRSTKSARPSPSPSPTAVWDRHPDSLAAVGDSITRGFDTCSLLKDCPSASWATGTDPAVDSLARRLLDSPRRQSWNYGVSGSVMADLAGQMRRAVQRDPDMVTVLSGANDACRPTVGQMTSVADYREGFRAALRTLRQARPKAQVYVASVPDLRRLWSVGRGNPLGERIWRFGICPSMLRDARSQSATARERRVQVRERVVAYNGVLREECVKDLRCRFDDGAVFAYRFTDADVSDWDWFHPSKQGQQRLAELAHRRVVSPHDPAR